MAIRIISLCLFCIVRSQEFTTLSPVDFSTEGATATDSSEETTEFPVDDTTGISVDDTTGIPKDEETTVIEGIVGAQRSLSLGPMPLPVLKFSQYHHQGKAPKLANPIFTTVDGHIREVDENVLTAGEDFQNIGQFVLDCAASYPIHWSRDGLEVSPSLKRNSSSSDGSSLNSSYTISLIVGTETGAVAEKDSGNYSCIAQDTPELTTSVYLYLPVNESLSPCAEQPCGRNAICELRHGNRSCGCLPGFVGNPEVDCREECSLNSDCPQPLVCVGNKCLDSCIGACGKYASCQLVEQIPICNCLPEYTGDPYESCDESQPIKPVSDICLYCGLNTVCVSTTNSSLVCKCMRNFEGDAYKKCEEKKIESPCKPSPCGENAFCEEKYSRAICHCEENFYGDPWTKCHPECVRREHCSKDQVCLQMRCKDACSDTCGVGAECRIVKPHFAECLCPEGKTGDPYQECSDIEINTESALNVTTSL